MYQATEHYEYLRYQHLYRGEPTRSHSITAVKQRRIKDSDHVRLANLPNSGWARLMWVAH